MFYKSNLFYLSISLLTLTGSIASAKDSANAPTPFENNCSGESNRHAIYSDKELEYYLSVDLKSLPETLPPFDPNFTKENYPNHRYKVYSELLEILTNPNVTKKIIAVAKEDGPGCLEIKNYPQQPSATGQLLPASIHLEISHGFETGGVIVFRNSQIPALNTVDSVAYSGPFIFDGKRHAKQCPLKKPDTDGYELPSRISSYLGNLRILKAIHEANSKISGQRKIEFYSIKSDRCPFRIGIIEVTSSDNRYRILIDGIEQEPANLEQETASKIYDVKTKKALD